jgi:hypothetical protein
MTARRQRTLLEERAFRHEMEDGVIELFAATVFLIPAFTLRQPAFSWMVALPILFGRRIIQRIRSRVTYPRIGFVEARRDPPAELFGGIAFWTVAALALVGAILFTGRGLLDPSSWRTFAPLLAGLLTSGGFVYAAQRSGLRRYFWFGAFAIAWGCTLSLLPGAPGYWRVQSFLLGMAGFSLLAGLVLMALFVRRYPIASNGENQAGVSDER